MLSCYCCCKTSWKSFQTWNKELTWYDNWEWSLHHICSLVFFWSARFHLFVVLSGWFIISRPGLKKSCFSSFFFQDNFFASFFLGWSITSFSGVCAYPFDTLRRRMMLTSGQPVKYRNARHAFLEIIRVEGFSSLFRGVTANMLLGVAGAGVLAGYEF